MIRTNTVGIRKKLVLAMGLILVTSIAVGLIALYAFERVSNALQTITESSVPFMANSMESTKAAMQLGSEVPLLANSVTTEEAQKYNDSLKEKSLKLQNLLTEKFSMQQKMGLGNSELQKEIDFESLVEQLNTSVDLRLSITGKIRQTISGFDAMLVDINKLLLDVIDTETFEFIMTSEELFDESGQVLDDMLSRHLDTLTKTLYLEDAVIGLSSVLIDEISVAKAASASTSPQVLSPSSVLSEEISLANSTSSVELKQSLLPHINAVKEKWEAIDESKLLDYPAISTLIGSLLQSVESEDFGDPRGVDFLNAYRTALWVNDTLKLSDNLVTSLRAEISSSYSEIYAAGQQLQTNVSSTIPETIDKGVNSLVGLLQMRAELNTISGVVAQVVQAQLPAAIQPLAERYTASREAIVESLDATRDIYGVSDIEAIVDRLFDVSNINTGIFQIRLDELAAEEQTQVTMNQINANMVELGSVLLQLAELSRAEVDSDGASVNALIGSSRIQIISILLLSVVFAVAVFWLVISKDILARLLETIHALRTLADGNYDVSVTTSGSDELSDLAQTVEVFRQSGLDAQRLQQEQMIASREREKLEQQQIELERKARAEESSLHETQRAEAKRQQEIASDLQRRVDQLLVAVSAASKGNLNHPVDANGEDVAGQMGQALRLLLSEFSHGMSGINHNAMKLTDASEHLNDLSTGMREVASANTEIARKASDLSTDVETGVNTVAGATEQLTSSIKEIARNTTEAETVAAEAVNLAMEADTTVRKLADSSQGIGNVIKVITSIAEQTNLLALNATIEAARAGESGKGFAVVATEVKELAKETAKATEQIESRINDIQTDTQSAVNSIESISSIIGNISSIQSTIAAAVDEQSSVTQEINRSIVQTSNGSQAITGLIDEVAQKASVNEESSVDMSTAARELSEMAVQLTELVARYSASDDTNDVRLAA